MRNSTLICIYSLQHQLRCIHMPLSNLHISQFYFFPSVSSFDAKSTAGGGHRSRCQIRRITFNCQVSRQTSKKKPGQHRPRKQNPEAKREAIGRLYLNQTQGHRSSNVQDKTKDQRQTQGSRQGCQG